MRNRSARFSALTLAQQLGRMSTTYPGFRGFLSRNRAVWTGTLCPGPISEPYAVEISYLPPKRPKVWVVEPHPVPLAQDARIPHTFPDGSVCLHLHEEWDARRFIADTIVPWLSLWLLHYEGWRVTGEWLGGGDEPREKR